MYDKLGDLLSETLDSGFIFSPEQPKNEEPKKQEPPPPPPKTDSEKKEKKVDFNFFRAKKPQPKGEVFKFSETPEQVFNALAFFELSGDASFDECKKKYHEKLMYFHPDKWSDNAVLQKISKEKTEQILHNWKILEDWFKKKN